MADWSCLATFLMWMYVLNFFHYSASKNTYPRARKFARVTDRIQVVEEVSICPYIFQDFL